MAKYIRDKIAVQQHNEVQLDVSTQSKSIKTASIKIKYRQIWSTMEMLHFYSYVADSDRSKTGEIRLLLTMQKL